MPSYELKETIQELASERGLPETVVVDVLARLLEDHYARERGWTVDVYWSGGSLQARRIIRQGNRWVERRLDIGKKVIRRLRPAFTKALSWEAAERRREELRKWVHQAVLCEVMRVDPSGSVVCWVEGARARGVLEKRYQLKKDKPYQPGQKVWAYVRKLDGLTLLLDRRSWSLPLALLRAWGWEGRAGVRRKVGQWTLLLVREGEVKWELRNRLEKALGERVYTRWVGNGVVCPPRKG